MVMKDKVQGSELHRLTEIKSYNPTILNKLYKICRPRIKKLTKHIDHRRLNVGPDLIESFFWDKFLYVFNKYQERMEFEELKAHLLVSLTQYSYKLMRSGYSEAAEYNQNLISFESLLDDSKEDLYIPDESSEVNIYHNLLEDFLIKNLTVDAFLVYSIQLNPPPFFTNRLKDSGGKLTILHLIDFFEYERSKDSINYFTSIRRQIAITLEKAKAELYV